MPRAVSFIDYIVNNDIVLIRRWPFLLFDFYQGGKAAITPSLSSGNPLNTLVPVAVDLTVPELVSRNVSAMMANDWYLSRLSSMEVFVWTRCKRYVTSHPTSGLLSLGW